MSLEELNLPATQYFSSSFSPPRWLLPLLASLRLVERAPFFSFRRLEPAIESGEGRLSRLVFQIWRKKNVKGNRNWREILNVINRNV